METILQILLVFVLSSLTCLLIAYPIRLINKKYPWPSLSITSWLAFPIISTMLYNGLLQLEFGFQHGIPVLAFFINIIIVGWIMRRVIGQYYVPKNARK